MFTGIIEEVGTVKQIVKRPEVYRITISAAKILSDVQLGDSISVNGICLTVTSFDSGSFSADAVPETLNRTNLHKLKNGSRVNLERAMPANGRFGGHFVTGHIDVTGRISSIRDDGSARIFTFTPEDCTYLKYVIPKGSVAIDGVSLTVTEADKQAFSVSIIPHTMEQTVLLKKLTGDEVNIECDMLGKYIERFLLHRQPVGIAAPKSKIDNDFLKDNGFI